MAMNRIKAVLAEKQLTSKWLAQELGRAENTVSRWCSNKVQPSLENLVEIAKVRPLQNLPSSQFSPIYS